MLALCGVPFTLFAQGVKCTISGKVIDQQNSPVAYASVAIYEDKTPIAGVITDSEVGAFVERLRSSEHWDNTLVVIISDHGRPSESETASSPERHHIPMGGRCCERGYGDNRLHLADRPSSDTPLAVGHRPQRLHI